MTAPRQHAVLGFELGPHARVGVEDVCVVMGFLRPMEMHPTVDDPQVAY